MSKTLARAKGEMYLVHPSRTLNLDRRSVSLNLRILSMWFCYGHASDVGGCSEELGLWSSCGVHTRNFKIGVNFRT